MGVCGVGVIFAGGAGFGAGFLLIEQLLKANIKHKTKVEAISVLFMTLSLLSNFMIRFFKSFYTVRFRPRASHSLPMAFCGIIYERWFLCLSSCLEP